MNQTYSKQAKNNPLTPFKENDFITYLNKEGVAQGIILLDHIEPDCHKSGDIYYHAELATPNYTKGSFLILHDHRVWHWGHAIRKATDEEVALLCRALIEVAKENVAEVLSGIEWGDGVVKR